MEVALLIRTNRFKHERANRWIESCDGHRLVCARHKTEYCGLSDPLRTLFTFIR